MHKIIFFGSLSLLCFTVHANGTDSNKTKTEPVGSYLASTAATALSLLGDSALADSCVLGEQDQAQDALNSGSGLRACGNIADLIANTFFRDSKVSKSDEGKYTLAQIGASVLRVASNIAMMRSEIPPNVDDREDPGNQWVSAPARLISLAASFAANYIGGKDDPENLRHWGLLRFLSIWPSFLADATHGDTLATICSFLASFVDSYEAVSAIVPEVVKKEQPEASGEPPSPSPLRQAPFAKASGSRGFGVQGLRGPGTTGDAGAEAERKRQERVKRLREELVALQQGLRAPQTTVSQTTRRREVKEEPEGSEGSVECVICAEECLSKDMCACHACGNKFCKHCMKNLCKLDEQRDTDLTPSAHPACLRYADDLSAEEFDRIVQYEEATLETEPELLWYHINGRDYFLEGGKLWRYDSLKSKRLPGPWRWIQPPKCPFCRELMLSRIEPYALGAI